MEDYHNSAQGKSPTADEVVLYRIISRHSWDRSQERHKAHPGSTIEHIQYGIYALVIPGDGGQDE